MGQNLIARLPILLIAVLYPLVIGLIFRSTSGKARDNAFAFATVALAFPAVILLSPASTLLSMARAKIIFFGFLAVFVAYFAMVLLSYGALLISRSNPRLQKLAFWTPLIELIFIKYCFPIDKLAPTFLWAVQLGHLSAAFIGISFLSFRLSHLAIEVDNEQVAMPSLAQYLAYAFFVPLLSVGPISPYSLFNRSYNNPNRENTPVLRSIGRILVGYIKFAFLSPMIAQFTYSGLILDGHPHAKIDLVIAIFAYAIFLYNNFSGMCDIAIGAAGLINIEVMENFDRPFLARNFQEFWSRWHITLSQWFRDIMFTPMVKALTRVVGPQRMNHAIAITIMSVFIVLGVWHGVGLNFLVFGVSQGLGVVFIHYSSAYMKRRLGKQGFQKYMANKTYRVLGQVATFCYFSLTLFLFANSFEDMAAVLKAIV